MLPLTYYSEGLYLIELVEKLFRLKIKIRAKSFIFEKVILFKYEVLNVGLIQTLYALHG
jgi:hypothetical protein